MTPKQEMEKAVKWSELSTEERDRLVHVRVMGNPEICTGKLTARYEDVPSRAGGTAFSYWHVTCDTCEVIGTYADKDAIPEKHPSKVEIPNYSTDMNAAMLIVNLEKWDNITIRRYWRQDIREKCGYRISINSKCVYDAEEILPAAICIAILIYSGVEIEP